MNNRGLHICVVTADFPGLTETFITNKVIELSKRGNTVTVIKNSDSGAINTSHLAQVKEANVTILKMNELKNLSSVITAVVNHPGILFSSLTTSITGFKKKFKSKLQLQLLNSKPFDVVHFEFSGLAVSYLSAIKNINAKTIVSCRGTAEKVKPLTDANRKTSLLNLFSSVDAIHCVSQDMANTIVNYRAPVNKIFVNTPAIDVGLFKRSKPYSKTDNTLTILTIGRFTFQKGYLIGLLAMKQLKNQGVNFRWLIVGDGPLSEAIIYHIHSLGLYENVQLLGKKNRDEVLELYNTVDVFLLPSVYEGIANVCLEAMAMELPVVSTKSGGMEEVIVHGCNGLLCEVYEPANIAEKIGSIATDYNYRKQLGIAARETVVNNFTLQKQVDVFEAKYRSLVNN